MENKNPIATDQEYQNLVQELKSIILKGQHVAYKAVDNIKVQTYWQIGERIVREELGHKNRADYGKYLVGELAGDLEIDKSQLHRIIRFYKAYQIVGAVHPQLSWYHYVELIKVENIETRLFYEQKIIQNSWGYRELRKQIKAGLYESTTPAEIQSVFETKLPAVNAPEIFKDTYNFNFLEPTESEKELEDQLLNEFENFLKELGEDFAILGRQVPIKIDSQTHFIDMVLYHRGIPCVILADLKLDRLMSQHIGQMNKYIGYYRQNKQYEHEKDTIGLIICRHAGKEEVRYALDGLEKKIFIAKYKSKLPSETKITKAVHLLGPVSI